MHKRIRYVFASQTDGLLTSTTFLSSSSVESALLRLEILDMRPALPLSRTVDDAADENRKSTHITRVVITMGSVYFQTFI